MKYKAILLDVDGTLIPYDYDSLPSDAVANAIIKAKTKISVFVVTGRALNGIKPILKKLDINTGLIVTNGGSVVLDLNTEKIIYDMPILESEGGSDMISILQSEGFEFWVKSSPLNSVSGDLTYKPGDSIEKIYMIYALEIYEHSKVTRLFNALSDVPNLALHKTKHKDPNKYGFNITHINATKLHGIRVLMKEKGLKREDMIGVGDGYNDFPLLAASGLKVAMGNAIPDLKEFADYIAPSVNEDGVVDVIEKFILNEEPPK